MNISYEFSPERTGHGKQIQNVTLGQNTVVMKDFPLL